ncbi:MAG: hypothetical protein FJ242_04970, partial [Nitrospira sp.]|nr:hypothetical protein [Nitrospira sp.]
MRIKIIFFFYITVFALLFSFPVHPASSEEPQKTSTLEKNKAEIIGSLEKFEHSLKVAKGCIAEAETD